MARNDATAARGDSESTVGETATAYPTALMTQSEIPTTPWGYIAYRIDRLDERMSRLERDLAVVRETTITRKSVVVSLLALAPIMAAAVTLAFNLGNQLWGEV